MLPLLLALLGCAGRPERPNLLVITLDTTRADHLGTWGYHRDTSSTLDALAEESIVFEQLLVPMATTLPSHTSLFTGTEPLEHGVLANVRHGGMQLRTSPSLRTLTQHLKDAGYHTGAVVSATPLDPGSGIEVGFATYDPPEHGTRDAQLASRRAEKWLEGTAKEPWFLWVHYYDPHGPFEPPKRHTKDYLRDGTTQAWLDERGIGANSARPTGQVLDSLEATNLYDGEIRYMDRQLERVIEAVKARGDWDRTVVVIAGDHGEGLGQHGMAGHGGVWLEQLHAPLLIRTPWDGARRVSRPLGMADVLPTLLGLVDLPGEAELRAQSSGVDALAAPERVLYHHSSERQLAFGRAQDALTAGPWRYVREESGADHLFLVDAGDPHERRDLGEVLPVHAAILHRWIDAERDRLDARGERLGRADAVPMDADRVEQLRALGYVDDAPPPEPGPAAEEEP